jgi:transposase
VSQPVFVGIDVSKNSLDVHLLPSGKSRRFANSRSGIRSLSSFLRKFNPQLVALEASGGCEQLLLACLVPTGLRMTLINPRRVRKHAESTGKLAKTDSIDAAVIADYALKNHERLRLYVLRKEQPVKRLVTRRRQLVEMRTGEKNRLKQASDAEIRKSIRATIAFLDRQVAQVEIEIEAAIEADPVMKQRKEILTSVPSVGDVTANTLIAELPEMGEANRREVAALAGVAPYDQTSGTHQGKKSISAGRRPVRSALHMAVVSAIRRNPVIRAFYLKLIAKGKPYKVAVTACVRKLLSILNTMVYKNQTWNPKMA